MNASALPPRAIELISPEAVNRGLDRLAAAVQSRVVLDNCLLLGILNGGLFPLVHLAERLSGDFLIDCCRASRYGDAVTGGRFCMQQPPLHDLNGMTVIIVDDILDQGLTLAGVRDFCLKQGAKEALSAVLIVKQTATRSPELVPDFTAGLTVPDVFVFGCGMDLAGHWRHLPAVFTLPEGD